MFLKNWRVCYCFTMAANLLTFKFRPPEVLCIMESNFDRERETFDDLIKNQMVMPRFICSC